MQERRRTPRASCRLHCRIQKGRDRVRARIVDVSEGGLCLLSQVWFEPKKSIEIAIDVPGSGESAVRAEVWHVKRQKTRDAKRNIWSIGVMLEESDDTYQKLLRSAGIAASAKTPAPSGAPRTASRAVPSCESPEDLIEPQVFRVRVKAATGPRTRLLTLTAESEDEARALAVRDLESAWTVIGVTAA